MIEIHEGVFSEDVSLKFLKTKFSDSKRKNYHIIPSLVKVF